MEVIMNRGVVLRNMVRHSICQLPGQKGETTCMVELVAGEQKLSHLVQAHDHQILLLPPLC